MVHLIELSSGHVRVLGMFIGFYGKSPSFSLMRVKVQ
jgi:hypothetical protein